MASVSSSLAEVSPYTNGRRLNDPSRVKCRRMGGANTQLELNRFGSCGETTSANNAVA